MDIDYHRLRAGDIDAVEYQSLCEWRNLRPSLTLRDLMLSDVTGGRETAEEALDLLSRAIQPILDPDGLFDLGCAVISTQDDPTVVDRLLDRWWASCGLPESPTLRQVQRQQSRAGHPQGILKSITQIIHQYHVPMSSWCQRQIGSWCLESISLPYCVMENSAAYLRWVLEQGIQFRAGDLIRANRRPLEIYQLVAENLTDGQVAEAVACHDYYTDFYGASPEALRLLQALHPAVNIPHPRDCTDWSSEGSRCPRESIIQAVHPDWLRDYYLTEPVKEDQVGLYGRLLTQRFGAHKRPPRQQRVEKLWILFQVSEAAGYGPESGYRLLRLTARYPECTDLWLSRLADGYPGLLSQILRVDPGDRWSRGSLLDCAIQHDNLSLFRCLQTGPEGRLSALWSAFWEGSLGVMRELGCTPADILSVVELPQPRYYCLHTTHAEWVERVCTGLSVNHPLTVSLLASLAESGAVTPLRDVISRGYWSVDPLSVPSTLAAVCEPVLHTDNLRLAIWLEQYPMSPHCPRAVNQVIQGHRARYTCQVVGRWYSRGWIGEGCLLRWLSDSPTPRSLTGFPSADLAGLEREDDHRRITEQIIRLLPELRDWKDVGQICADLAIHPRHLLDARRSSLPDQDSHGYKGSRLQELVREVNRCSPSTPLQTYGQRGLESAPAYLCFWNWENYQGAIRIADDLQYLSGRGAPPPPADLRQICLQAQSAGRPKSARSVCES